MMNLGMWTIPIIGLPVSLAWADVVTPLCA
jgi:hypothetical protein